MILGVVLAEYHSEQGIRIGLEGTLLCMCSFSSLWHNTGHNTALDLLMEMVPGAREMGEKALKINHTRGICYLLSLGCVEVGCSLTISVIYCLGQAASVRMGENTSRLNSASLLIFQRVIYILNNCIFLAGGGGIGWDV